MLKVEDIPRMEAALAAVGVPVAELCRQAGIAETTWGRWRNQKFKPSYRAWGDVVQAYEALISQTPAEDAA